MRSRAMASWFILPALAAAALVTLAPAASAGHGNSCGRGRGYGQRRVTYVQPGYYARPVYAAPRYQRVVVVRPTPYVRIGGRFGAVNIDAVFGPQRQYSSYQYGCNFCDSRFTTYEGYSNHVQSCPHRPSYCRVEARRWNIDGYDNTGYDNTGYDPGYDDGYGGTYYGGGYNNGNYGGGQCGDDDDDD